MPNLYAVTISYTTVIRAENSVDAKYQAQDLAREIVNDANDPDDVVVHREITESSQLKGFGGWDNKCLPYGDVEGDKTIGEYLGDF